MKHVHIALLVLALSLLAAACGTADASGPPEIQYGRDICTECNMIITEAKYATAYRLADGTDRKFDDVGDMVVYLQETGEEPTDTWVHDFETEEWIEVAGAHFVPTLSVSSPMGHSILAFSDMARASTFAADVGGEVIHWDEVLLLPTTDGLVGHHHMEMDSDHGMDDMDADHDMGSDDSMDMDDSEGGHTDH